MVSTPSNPNHHKGTNCEIPPRPNSRKLTQNARPNSVQKPVSALPMTSEGNHLKKGKGFVEPRATSSLVES